MGVALALPIGAAMLRVVLPLLAVGVMELGHPPIGPACGWYLLVRTVELEAGSEGVHLELSCHVVSLVLH